MKAAIVVYVAGFASGALAQGTFQNLSFQCANLTPVPAGQYGGLVSIADALPGWTGYVDGQQVTQVLQNNLNLGNAGIALFGPNWNGDPPLVNDGYTLVLQTGNEGPPNGGQNLGGSEIEQTGSIPANANSIQFEALAGLPGSFSVNLDGVSLSLVPLQTGAYYTLYGASIPSAFIGETVSLSISAYGTPGADYFGPLQFSPSDVPEPNALELTGVAGVAFGLYRRIVAKVRRAAAA